MGFNEGYYIGLLEGDIFFALCLIKNEECYRKYENGLEAELKMSKKKKQAFLKNKDKLHEIYIEKRKTEEGQAFMDYVEKYKNLPAESIVMHILKESEYWHVN